MSVPRACSVVHARSSHPRRNAGCRYPTSSLHFIKAPHHTSMLSWRTNSNCSNTCTSCTYGPCHACPPDNGHSGLSGHHLQSVAPSIRRHPCPGSSMLAAPAASYTLSPAGAAADSCHAHGLHSLVASALLAQVMQLLALQRPGTHPKGGCTAVSSLPYCMHPKSAPRHHACS